MKTRACVCVRVVASVHISHGAQWGFNMYHDIVYCGTRVKFLVKRVR